MTPLDDQTASAGSAHMAIGLITLMGVQRALIVAEAICAQIASLPVLPAEHPAAVETDRLRSIAHAAREAIRKTATGPAIVLAGPGTHLTLMKTP